MMKPMHATDMLIILEVWETYESATWNRCDC